MNTRKLRAHRHRNVRRGNIIVLTAILMTVLMGVLALSVDVGYMLVARQEAQRAADSAALAAAWELIDEAAPQAASNHAQLDTNARGRAGEYVGLNTITSAAAQLAQEDVNVGYLSNPTNPAVKLLSGSAHKPNAVEVRVRRTEDQNGEIPLFFAKAIGYDTADIQATATAALVTNVGGFRATHDGSNLCLLPFALDEDAFQDLVSGTGSDDYTYDPDSGNITWGSDGVVEVNLYPQGTGSPGNRGTVDIGSSNNSTNDIARQISEGVSTEDMDYHGGELVLDNDGHLYLNGDTGISAGVKDELTSIKGEPRVIPIFRTVDGNGNNAQYTIVGFCGVRIMHVKLTGSMTSKKVMIQPCNVVCKGTVPTSVEGSSYFIYSPPWLVR